MDKTNNKKEGSRKKIASPEQLTDYLRVTNPATWVLLTAAILLVLSLIVWACIGTIESSTEALANVENGTARLVPYGVQNIEEGMIAEIDGQEYAISAVEEDDMGRPVGLAEVPLSDGKYEARIITERLKPISFLTESR